MCSCEVSDEIKDTNTKISTDSHYLQIARLWIHLLAKIQAIAQDRTPPQLRPSCRGTSGCLSSRSDCQQCPFCRRFTATFFSFRCHVLVISWCEWAQCNAEMLCWAQWPAAASRVSSRLRLGAGFWLPRCHPGPGRRCTHLCLKC